MPAPPFDFARCIFGDWPYRVGEPSLHRAGDGFPGDTSGGWVGYFNGVMRCKTGHWNVDVTAPYNYDWYSVQACLDLQRFFGISPLISYGVVCANTWPIVDYLATH